MDRKTRTIIAISLGVITLLVWANVVYLNKVLGDLTSLNERVSKNSERVSDVLEIVNSEDRESRAARVARVIRERIPHLTSNQVARISLAIVDTSNRFPEKLSVEVILSLIEQESSFNPEAESKVGAIGLMQVMPDTAYPILRNLGYPEDPELLYDPVVNVEVGLQHLQYLCMVHESQREALEAYFWGSRNVWRLQEENPQLIASVGYSRKILARASSEHLF